MKHSSALGYVRASGRNTIVHVEALHNAAHLLEEFAERRRERMPSSSLALAEFARDLRALELILLEELSAEKAATYWWPGKPKPKAD